MKRNVYKIYIIILIIISLFSTNYCWAQSDLGLGDLSSYGGYGTDSTILKDKINPIIHIIQIVGSILSVVVLIAIGIKYMVGSIEEKAQYKKTLMPYVIGCIMVFSISNLVSMIFNVAITLF